MFKKVILVLLLICLSSCYAPTIIPPVNSNRIVTNLYGTDTKIVIDNIASMGKSDKEIARKSLKLIAIIDPKQTYPHLPDELYWADLGTNYSALTVTRSESEMNITRKIYMNRLTMLVDKNDCGEWLYFGAILSHELHHYFYDSIDPYTTTVTDGLIYRKILENPNILIEFKSQWEKVKKTN